MGISELIYKSFYKIGYTIVTQYCKHVAKVDHKAITFISRPDYSDNSRALSDYLLSKQYDKKYKINWLIDRTADIDIDFRIHPIKKNNYGKYSLRDVFAFLTSGVVFTTHGFSISADFAVREQRKILLWHGCGYKGKMSADGKLEFEKALVPGSLFVKPKSEFWNVPQSSIMSLGYPRYDWLLHPSQNALDLYKKLLGDKKKLVIWMPTFRNTDNMSFFAENQITAFPLMKDNLEWQDLDEKCESLGIELLVKLHMFQKQYDINWHSFKNIHCISNDDFENAGIMMYEFLSYTDALISDYSSIAVDYLILNKPIAFALDDFETYKSLRGFVFDDPRIYMPGHHLYSIDDLIGFLHDISNGMDKYADKRKAMYENSITISDHYCSDIIADLGL